MRKAAWIFTPALILGLVGCGDDGRTTDSGATGATGTTGTTDGTTTGTTAEATTGTTAEATTGEPTTGAPTTGFPTTTGTTTTDATTTDATTTTGDVGPTCEAYCAIYETACVDFAEYDNTQACLDQCGQWPSGSIDDTAGDTLGCRLYHVTVASQVDANMHCPHASPNGAGVCVDPNAPTCEEYCTTYFANCTGDLNVYNDEADCMNQCSHWYPGKVDDTVGDTVGCRLYHAGVAGSEPNLHCPHASPGGGGVCVVQ